MLIDAHCHLDDAQFLQDVDAVVERAAQAGIQALITAGVDVPTSQVAVALADKYESVFAVIGIHPHHARECDDSAVNAIRSLAAGRKVVGIGEIGLDFHYADGAPRDIQEKWFAAQLDLAADLAKPVVVHDRDAHDAIIDMLKRRGGQPRGLLHCFSGDLAMARQAIELGFLVSFAGNVTFRNAGLLQQVARELPLEKIVVETDAPYLSPRRGRRNEPANVQLVAAKIAELKRLPSLAVADRTSLNGRSLFNLPQTE